MRDTEIFEITKEWVMKHRTRRGGWTRAQILALGLDYPVKTCWIDELVGKHIRPSQATAFEQSKAETASKQKSAEKKAEALSDVNSAIEYLEKNKRAIGYDALEKLCKLVGDVRKSHKR